MEHRRGSFWRIASTLLGVVLFLVLFVAMGAFLAECIQSAGYEHVEGRIEAFSGRMRVIRPLVLLAILLAWGFLFWGLGRSGLVNHATYSRAIVFWPHLAIWTAILELGIGQGWLIPSVCLAFVMIFLRSTEKGQDFSARLRQILWSDERENDQ